MIHLKDVSYCYPTRDTSTINGITLDIERGDFVLVSGPTGCGKTTLIKMFNGIIPHLSKGRLGGKLIVADRDVRVCSMEDLTREVGLIFQSPDDQIISNTVEEEVAFGLENLGFEIEEIERRVDWALNKTGISGLKTRDTKALSGGQKQRVVIASQIALKPKILAFDEPLSQLDPKGAREVMKCIVDLNKEGVTVIMIEHRVADIVKYVNKVLLLDKGRVAYYGEVKKSFSSEFSAYKRLGVQIPDEVKLSLGFSMEDISFSYEELKRTFDKKKPLENCYAAERQDEFADNSNTEEIISFKDVAFEYVKGNRVLSEVNLKVFNGETVAFMGANGSGKTTLISLIAGMNKPDKGTVAIRGEKVKSINHKQMTSLVGLLIQNPDLMLFCDTVEKELLFGPKHKKVNSQETNQRINSVFESLGLGAHKSDPPFSLSVGQRLRTALGAVLTLQPPVLLLDEPTTGQNQENVMKIMKMLKSLNFIKTIIFCTHDIYTAMRYADRIIVLNSGSIAFDGPAKDIFNDISLMKRNNLSIPVSVRLSKDSNCQKTFFTAEELIEEFTRE